MSEHVAVPLIELEPGMREALQTPTSLMETEMQLIERLRKVRRQMPDRDGKPGGMTVQEAKDKVVRDRIEAMRPHSSWKKIADSLGIAEKTLRIKRNQLCD